MIAEFRELSGLTPDELGTQRWFHPLHSGSAVTTLIPH
jgi:hypothetical protein